MKRTDALALDGCEIPEAVYPPGWFDGPHINLNAAMVIDDKTDRVLHVGSDYAGDTSKIEVSGYPFLFRPFRYWNHSKTQAMRTWGEIGKLRTITCTRTIRFIQQTEPTPTIEAIPF